MTQSGSSGTERTVGQLVVDATRDVQDIIRHEIALAKAELKDDAKQAGLAAGLFGAAGYLAVIASILIFVAAAWALNEGLDWPRWLSFLVVAVVLLVVAAILGLVGRSRISKVTPPERTVATSKQTVEALKGHQR